MQFTRRKTDDGLYELTGPHGTLTYEPTWASLSADGDLPPWIIAFSYGQECAAALRLSEDTLWGYMQNHYLVSVERSAR